MRLRRPENGQQRFLLVFHHCDLQSGCQAWRLRQIPPIMGEAYVQQWTLWAVVVVVMLLCKSWEEFLLFSWYSPEGLQQVLLHVSSAFIAELKIEWD